MIELKISIDLSKSSEAIMELVDTGLTQKEIGVLLYKMEQLKAYFMEKSFEGDIILEGYVDPEEEGNGATV